MFHIINHNTFPSHMHISANNQFGPLPKETHADQHQYLTADVNPISRDVTAHTQKQRVLPAVCLDD